MIERLSFEFKYFLNKAPWDTGISPQELTGFLESTAPGHVLELGCGTGTNALTMAQLGWEVEAIDISHIAIKRARRKARVASLNINFQQGDVTDLDRFQGLFDFVLDIGCFHVLSSERRELYAHNLERLLKTGGTFMLYTWLNVTTNDLTWVPTKEEIQGLFGRSMEFIQIEQSVDSNVEHTSAWFSLRKIPQ